MGAARSGGTRDDEPPEARVRDALVAEAEPPVVAPDGAAVTADESIREEATEPVAESPAPPRVVALYGGDRRIVTEADVRATLASLGDDYVSRYDDGTVARNDAYEIARLRIVALMELRSRPPVWRADV